MCRNIKSLRIAQRQATDVEIAEAALQYVRKVSGFHKPSRINQNAFDAAVTEIGEATRKLLVNLAAKS
jgi:hypothetical protein